MSFDVFAQAFRDGSGGAGDVAAARAVISTVCYKHNSEFRSYNVEFPDGSELEMYADPLDGSKPFAGAMFALRALTDSVANFMFEFTRAAGWVLLPAMEPACILLVSEEQSKHLPEDLSADRQVIVVSSGGELAAALDGGYDSWRAYRDRVVGRSDGSINQT
jgi:hypothetical protein